MTYDPATDTWTIRLNRYQRDNLLSLFNAIGYPHPKADPIVPLSALNTGDWVGEIPNMLQDADGSIMATRPNASPDELRQRIAWALESAGWVKP